MSGSRRPLDWSWALGLPFLIIGLWTAVAGSGTALMALATFFTLLGALICFGSYRANRYTLLRNRLRKGHPEEPWMWRPDWAARRIESKSRAFGTTVFEMETVPARPGSELRGRIVTTFTDLPPGGFTVKLKCRHVYVTGVARKRTLHDEVLWEATRTVAPDRTHGGIHAPVRFDIPADAHPTNDDNPNNEIIWQIEVSGEPGGRSFGALFPLPVY